MTLRSFNLISATLIAFALSSDASAQSLAITVPPVPQNIRVPAGHTAYLKGSAIGTQNYVCIPGATKPVWQFLGPQATLYFTFPWIQGEGKQQIMTHYLSANPAEVETNRPTWQSSLDTSTVWAKAAATSSDPAFVAPGAIPWLLLEIVGKQRGPMGGTSLGATTYIQRVNTSGGTAPSTSCESTTYGKFELVPYTTDYYFFKANN